MLRRVMLLLAVAALLTTAGCGALIGAGAREMDDHGDDARYENKSFGEHFVDELFEDDCGCEDYCHHH